MVRTSGRGPSDPPMLDRLAVAADQLRSSLVRARRTPLVGGRGVGAARADELVAEVDAARARRGDGNRHLGLG